MISRLWSACVGGLRRKTAEAFRVLQDRLLAALQDVRRLGDPASALPFTGGSANGLSATLAQSRCRWCSTTRQIRKRGHRCFKEARSRGGPQQPITLIMKVVMHRRQLFWRDQPDACCLSLQRFATSVFLSSPRRFQESVQLRELLQLAPEPSRPASQWASAYTL